MMLTLKNFLYTVGMILAISLSTVTATPTVCKTISVNPTSQELTLVKSNGEKVLVQLNKADSYLTSYLTTATPTKDLYLKSNANVSDGTYEMQLINGIKVTVEKAAGDNTKVSIKSEVVSGKDSIKSSKDIVLEEAPKFSDTDIQIRYKDNGVDKDYTISNGENVEALKFYQKSGITPNGLADDSYKFTNKHTKHEIYLVVSGTDLTVLVIQPDESWYVALARHSTRPAIFLALTGLFSGLMGFIVKNLDPEMYELGGGFRGAFFGQESIQNEVGYEVVSDSMDLATVETPTADSDTPTIASSPEKAPRRNRETGPRSSRTSTPSEPTGMTTDAAAASETLIEETQIGEEVAEKSNASYVTFMVVASTALCLLL